MTIRSGRQTTIQRAPDHPPVDQLRPMLPVLRDEPFDSDDYIFEVKWGGVRIIATLEDGTVRLHGRNLRDLTPLYPELQSIAKCFKAGHAVLDGEMFAWGAESLPSFDLGRPRLLRPDAEVPATRRGASMLFQAFDLLALDGEWLLERPLFERRNLLHERLRPNKVVQAADFVSNEGTAFFEAVASHRLEGVIAKDKQSPYRPGERSPAWQEIRATQSDDFVIGGYTFGGGRRNDLIASLLLGAYRSGQLEFVGEVSIGYGDKEARQLLDLLEPLHAERSAFDRPPAVTRFLYWCRPELACHVRFAEWSRDGLLRFPVFVAPRPDIPAEECILNGE